MNDYGNYTHLLTYWVAKCDQYRDVGAFLMELKPSERDALYRYLDDEIVRLTNEYLTLKSLNPDAGMLTPPALVTMKSVRERISAYLKQQNNKTERLKPSKEKSRRGGAKSKRGKGPGLEALRAFNREHNINPKDYPTAANYAAAVISKGFRGASESTIRKHYAKYLL